MAVVRTWNHAAFSCRREKPRKYLRAGRWAAPEWSGCYKRNEEDEEDDEEDEEDEDEVVARPQQRQE